MKFTNLLIAIAFVALFSATSAIAGGLQAYKAESSVSGTLTSVGSDTLANLMSYWTEDFKRVHGNVTTQVQAAGSSTAPPALTEGASNIGPMSRMMKSREVEAFERRYGYKPTAIPVAIDALAVFVHRDNPIESLSIAELDAIFSSTRKCGYRRDINRWGQLGLGGALASADIQLYGRNSVSGTYGYFKKKALCKGDYKSTVNEQPGSASVVQSVSESINGIGYSGMGYKTSSVRTVPLSKRSGRRAYDATEANALTGKYPLARFLYVYVNKVPNKPLSKTDPVVAEFVRMILSATGQASVEKDGFVALPARVADRVLSTIE